MWLLKWTRVSSLVCLSSNRQKKEGEADYITSGALFTKQSVL